MEKMTRKEYFEALKGFVKGNEREAEFIEFLDKQIALVTKKNETLTKAQKENLVIVDKIYDFMKEVDRAVTIDEIMQKFELSSNQKASALMKKLVDANKVTKGKDGKKVVYTLV